MAKKGAPPDDVGDGLEKKRAAYEALKSGNLEKAKDLFLQLSQTYPWVASFKFNVALTDFKQGRLLDALNNLNAGLAIEPGDEKAQSMKQVIESRCKNKQQNETPSEEGITRKILERNHEDVHLTSSILDGQNEFPRILLFDEASGISSPTTNQPGYGSSRLMNFVLFETQRRRQETRSTHGNDIDDEPHATRLSWYFTRGEMDDDNKAIPNNVVFLPRPNLNGESADDLISKIDLLPKNEDTVFIDTMKTRYSYDIGYIKEYINELHRLNQYEQSVQACMKFLEHFPDDLEILFELGNIHMEKGNLVQSEATFKKIIELYYENAYAWHNLARVYEIKGFWQFEAFCLQQSKTFGYLVDEIRLARLMLKGIPIDPFTDNVHWE